MMCKISKFQEHSSVQNINVKQATIRMILDNGFQKKIERGYQTLPPLDHQGHAKRTF